MDRSLLKQVENMYRLQVFSAQPVGSVYKKTAIYRLETSSGFKAFKQFYFSETELRFVTSVLLWLYKAGAAVVRPIRTKDRKLYLKAGKRLFYLTDWVDGNSFDAASMVDVKQVASSIANLHLLARNVQFHGLPVRRKYPANSFVELENRHQHFTRQIRKLELIYPLPHAAACEAGIFIEQGERAIEIMKKQLELDSIAEEERALRQIVHRDLTSPNLLLGAAGPCILDFDLCAYGSCSADLAGFLANTLKWSIPAGTAAWESYLEIHPLSRDSRLLTICQMLLPREAWEIIRLYELQEYKAHERMIEQTQQAFLALLSTQADKEKFVAHLSELTDDM